jgi:transcriptional regulator GlxA family with amidase domain
MDNMKRVEAGIVNYPGAYLSAIYGMKDILEYSDENMARRFDIRILSLEEFVDDVQGLDYVVFPPCRSSDVPRLVADAKFVGAIVRYAERGATPVSVCAGAFFLCASGLADGLRTVTHWHLAKTLQEQFPRVKVLRDVMLFDEGSFISAGGMTGYQDLSLYLIKKHVSEDAALRVASVFLINSGERSQLQYAIRDLALSGDETLAKAQRFIRENFRKDIGLADIAEPCGVSPRTLLRRFRADGEFSPAEYVQATRIAHARKMLESSPYSVKRIADESGYRDLVGFTRTFGRIVGVTPGAYRRQRQPGLALR